MTFLYLRLKIVTLFLMLIWTRRGSCWRLYRTTGWKAPQVQEGRIRLLWGRKSWCWSLFYIRIGSLQWQGFLQPKDFVQVSSQSDQFQIESLQQAADMNPQNLDVAIVTFQSILSAVRAQQTVHSVTPHTWVTSPAPEPRDLIWANLTMSFASRSIRFVLMSYEIKLLRFSLKF